MRLRIIPAVTLDEPRFAYRPAGAALQRRHRVDQRQQLGHVVPMRGGQPRDERNPMRVGENMMFRPGLAAIGRVRSSFSPRAVRGVTHCRPQPTPDRVGPVVVTRRARRRAAASKRRRVASGPTAASTCSHSRNPSPSGACSTGCRCGARTKCPSTPHGRESAADPHTGGCVDGVSGAGVRCGSISRRRSGLGSYLTASLSVRRPYQAFRRSTRGRSVNFATHS